MTPPQPSVLSGHVNPEPGYEQVCGSVLLVSKKGFGLQGHDPDAAKFLIKPDDPLLSLTRLISQNDIVSLRDVKRSSPPRSDATCFHTVLAGSGHLQVTVNA